MADFTEILPKDVIIKIASYLGSSLFALSGVNRRLYDLFKEDRQKILELLTNRGKIILSGNNSSFFLKKNGDVYATGMNFSGQLGVGDDKCRNVWTKSGPPGKKVIRLLSKYGVTLALCTDAYYACGTNMYGQMGLGFCSSRVDWVKIGPAGKKVFEVKLGMWCIFVLCEDGWYSSGRNFRGSLGTGDLNKRLEWTKIQALDKVILELIPGAYHTFVRCEDAWYACGLISVTWIKIDPPSKTIENLIFKSYGANDNETIFVRCGEAWYARGDNYFGQLATGDRETVLDWIKIEISGRNIYEVHLLGNSTFIRCEDGWYGCGEDPRVDYDVDRGGRFRFNWTKIEFPGKEIIELRALNLRDIFVRTQDAWYARGESYTGRLSIKEKNAIEDWIKIAPEGKTVHRLFSGKNHTFALCDDGWYACGDNSHGQLGKGDNNYYKQWVKLPLPAGQSIISLDEIAESDEKRLKK